MRLQWVRHDPKTDLWARVALVGYLASDDLELRTEAMRRLEVAGEDELLPYLRECLTHPHYLLSSAAAGVLVHMGDDSVFHQFIDTLADPSFNVRQRARWAILEFDDSPPLVRHMQRLLRRRHCDESLVNIDSFEELAKLGDERAIPCLIEAFDGAMSDEVIAAGAKALGRFGIECDEDTPIEPLREEWRRMSRNLSGPALLPIYGEGATQDQEGERQTMMMIEEKTVSVRLEDLCRIADAVRTMMHDLDNGKRKNLHIDIETVHEVVEKWVSDEEVLGGCGHRHRCRVCQQFELPQ